MNTVAITYLVISIFVSVECTLRRYSAIRQDNGIVRSDNLLQENSGVSLKDITLMLYTRKNVKEKESFKPDQAAKLGESDVFDPKMPNFFIFHGWASNYKSIESLKNAILEQTDMNVFIVDWKRPASWTYRLARDVVSELGDFTAEFINNMIKKFSMPTSSIKMVGCSLGAHIAACASKKTNGQIDYLIGIDPAKPLFKLSDLDRLNISDASFVQVIHTCASLYGFDSSLGHVDIYPNGGYKQPGCEMDLTQICSHGRAYDIYYESILSGGFTTKKCDTYKNYKNGICNNNIGSYMGRIDIDKTASGDHYLDTNSKSPYSKN